MIVRCERCETRFKLDESRIPARGARVRCSRCKHAFFVTPPGAAPADVVHAVAAAAARAPADAKRPPEPSWDLEEGPGATVARRPDAPAAARAPAAGDADEEQNDWRFEDEVPGLDPGASHAGLDPLGGAPAPALGAEADPDESSFADLGDPETWDLLASETPPAIEGPAAPPPVVEAPAPAEVVPDAIEAAAAGETLVEPSAPPLRPHAAPAFRRSTVAPPAVVVPRTLPPARRHPSAATTAGWTGVVVLAAAIAWGAFRPPAPASGPLAASVAPVAGFEVSQARARIVENAAVGPILVVSGRLRNPGPAPRALGGPLAVRLLASGGAALAGGSAPAGAALPEASIREQPPERLLAAQAAAAAGFVAAPVAAGAELAFAAIFAPAPHDAQGFTLAPAGAGQGSP